FIGDIYGSITVFQQDFDFGSVKIIAINLNFVSPVRRKPHINSQRNDITQLRLQLGRLLIQQFGLDILKALGQSVPEKVRITADFSSGGSHGSVEQVTHLGPNGGLDIAGKVGNGFLHDLPPVG